MLPLQGNGESSETNSNNSETDILGSERGSETKTKSSERSSETKDLIIDIIKQNPHMMVVFLLNVFHNESLFDGLYTETSRNILFLTSAHGLTINSDNQVLTLCVLPLLQVKTACKTL